jgi:maltooligosyltrehalose trehalohydrolase
VNFLQNHDQVGNRAFGERLSVLAPPQKLRSFLPIFLLAPSIPLLFMGEEFAADTPFLFFADFGGDLAKAVRDGRRASFAGFPPFDDEAEAQRIPVPGADATLAAEPPRLGLAATRARTRLAAAVPDLLAIRPQRIVPCSARSSRAVARFAPMRNRST